MKMLSSISVTPTKKTRSADWNTSGCSHQFSWLWLSGKALPTRSTSDSGKPIVCVPVYHQTCAQCDTVLLTCSSWYTEVVPKVSHLTYNSAPNGKCWEGYIAPCMVRLMYQYRLKWRETILNNSKIFIHFCHLIKFVRPETFRPTLLWQEFCITVCIFWVIC